MKVFPQLLIALEQACCRVTECNKHGGGMCVRIVKYERRQVCVCVCPLTSRGNCLASRRRYLLDRRYNVTV